MIYKLIQWFKRNACKECNYYCAENNVCQSKKCATCGCHPYVNWFDRHFCEPYKAESEKSMSKEKQNYMDILEKQMQEPCDDTISRKAAINAMIKIEQDDIDRYGCKIPEGFDSSPAIEALNGLPSVTPQPKMGCEGCTYEKTGNNSTYPCSHCSRCYTDKYKAERNGEE